jgi:hypothetical protein
MHPEAAGRRRAGASAPLPPRLGQARVSGSVAAASVLAGSGPWAQRGGWRAGSRHGRSGTSRRAQPSRAGSSGHCRTPIRAPARRRSEPPFRAARRSGARPPPPRRPTRCPPSADGLAASCCSRAYRDRPSESGFPRLDCLLDRLAAWLPRVRPRCFAAPSSLAFCAVPLVCLALLPAPLAALPIVPPAP